METLLPSEVARLVLGYLEEEKCVDAAQCFLNSSPDLGEIRSIAKKGKKYPTKVNGYSLKEVLEEYSLVHSIVQDSMSSMSEQPGGNMIDCLRLLVRACQPVQVHINLHPQQGQGLSTSKSDNPDTASGSSRVRSKKNSFSQGQSVDPASTSQSVLSQILPDSSSQKLGPLNRADLLPTQQRPAYLPSVSRQDQYLNQNLNLNVQLSTPIPVHSGSHSGSGPLPPTDQHIQSDVSDASRQNTFLSVPSYQDAPLQVVTQLQSSITSNNGQQQTQLPPGCSNDLVVQASSVEHVQPSEENANVLQPESGSTLGDQLKPDDPSRSYTVTKCFGSSIVILGDNNTQSCLPTGNILNSNSILDNEELKSEPDKLHTPSKSNIPKPSIEEMTQTVLNYKPIIEKIAENINRFRTPAKQSSDAQPVDEVTLGLDEALPSIVEVTAEDPCFHEIVLELLQCGEYGQSIGEASEDEGSSSKGQKKKKRVKKKPNCAAGAEGLSSPKVTRERVGTVGGPGAAPEGATPAKIIQMSETLTPFSKFLKSMTSPSGEHYIDPVQFANLIDVPGSATKTANQSQPCTSSAPLPEQPSQPSGISDGPFIVPNGVTMISCSSQQQKDQYLFENGVKTYCELITVPAGAAASAGSYVPIVPRLLPGTTYPPETPQMVKPRKRSRPKRCLTRGGRQSGGQMRSDTDQKNMVTLYGSNGKDEVSSTVSYSASSDLPILIADASNEVVEVENQNTNIVEDDLKEHSNTNTEDSGGSSQLESVVVPAENKTALATQAESLSAVSEEKPVPPEPLSTIPEGEKVQSGSKEDFNLPSLNASVIRNTPGFSGPSRANTKRLSLSTPRRPSSHIRALDFNTPPKENNQSVRRANTSPKTMSSNAISPRTAGKSIKSVVRGGLFKPPSDGLRRTSKAKTHLFKSPEYALSSSSGFKIPSSAATSTPAQGLPNVTESPVPPPNAAWEKVGGVSLMVDPDVSPVVRKEPACRKGLTSWDADLRSCLGHIEPPAPSASRKRKMNPPTQKPKSKKSKKTEEAKETRECQDRDTSSEVNVNDQNKSRDISNESESEMAKLIEDNLLNTSLESVPSVEKGNVSKPGLEPSPLKTASPTKNVCEGGNKVEGLQQELEKNACGDEPECSNVPAVSSNPNIDQSECEDKGKEQLSHSGESASLLKENLVSADQARDSNTTETSGTVGDKNEDVLTKVKVKTPIVDPSSIMVSDKIRLSLVTFRESFAFDTPVKDNLCNFIPQTPRFLDPSSAPKEDTPRTKIIKAMTFSIPSGDSFVGTPTPGAPPTPTIRTTPSVSPNCPAYFQPGQSSSIPEENDSSVVKPDNLESILIQECSRIEAGGMRNAVRKFRKASCESAIDVLGCSPEHDAEKAPTISEQSSAETHSDNNGQDDSDKESSPTVSTSSEPEFPCARSIIYKRKVASVIKHSKTIVRYFPNNGKPQMSGDESDCQIVSPTKFSSETANEICDTEKGCKEMVQETSFICSASKLEAPQEPLHSDSCLGTVQTESVDTEHSLKDTLGTNAPFIIRKSATKSSPSPRKVTLSPALTCSEQPQSVLKGNVVNDHDNIVKHGSVKNNLSTPQKDKESALRMKPPSSKKKVALANNQDQEATDNESSDSSCSDSSSESDSNTSSSSSSSSSDEGTPAKRSTPMKAKISPSVGIASPRIVLSGTDAAVNSENSSLGTGGNADEGEPCSDGNKSVKQKCTAESIETEVKALIETKDMELSEDIAGTSCVLNAIEKSKGTEGEEGAQQLDPKSTTESIKSDLKSPIETKDMESSKENVETSCAHNSIEENISVEKKVSAEQLLCKSSTESVKLDLKSLIETKDMGSCEKIAKARSAHNSGSNVILSELHEKRRRTLEQLKKGPSTKRTLKESKEKKLISDEIIPQCVPDGEEDKDNKPTKDCKPNTEKPKKQRSKSEVDKLSSAEESNDLTVRQKGALDGARISDDDEEFRLRLSGDEKEDSPPKSSKEPCDSLELEIAALHGAEMTSRTSSGAQKPLCPQAKTEVNNGAPETSGQSMKIAPRNVVSSKAADELIKVLMKEGFGVPLPPVPSQKIKKVDPNVIKADSNIKSGKSNSMSPEQKEPTSSQTFSTMSVEKTYNEESLDTDDSSEVGYEEVINTSSTNSHVVALSYKGLGISRAKKNTPVKLDQTYDMGDFNVSLTLTSFISLFDSTPRTKLAETTSVHRRGRNSDYMRLDSKSQRPDNNRFFHPSTHGTDSRRRQPRDKSPRDRSSRHYSDSRTRRNRSPSPRAKHDRHYSADDRRRKDNHQLSRSDHYSRKQVTHSSQSRKYPDTESRSADSSSSKTKSAPKKCVELKMSESKVSKSKSKEDAEEGELLSSDSDFEPKSNKQRKRVSNLSSSTRCAKGLADTDALEKGTMECQQASSNSPGILSRLKCQNVNLERRKGARTRKSTLNNIPDTTTAGSRTGQSAKDGPSEEEVIDTDLDGMDFPMLGDEDESDAKGTEQNRLDGNEQTGVTTRRRAPPRSVNAHKTSVSENKTPVQRGKRKLSISPDFASEDSCQSTSAPLNPDTKQKRLSRRSKKPATSTNTCSPTTTNPSNGSEDVADPTEIIKNLDVESFLAKVHG